VGARERMWAFSDVGLVARAAFIISWLRTKWWSFCLVDGTRRRAPLASCLANMKKKRAYVNQNSDLFWWVLSSIWKYSLNKLAW
jgi:hypothetical protein